MVCRVEAESVAALATVKDLRGASPEAAVAAGRAQGGRCMSGRSAALGIPLESPVNSVSHATSLLRLPQSTASQILQGKQKASKRNFLIFPAQKYKLHWPLAFLSFSLPAMEELFFLTQALALCFRATFSRHFRSLRTSVISSCS